MKSVGATGTQAARGQVVPSAQGVVQGAVQPQGHGVDGEVPAAQVGVKFFLKRRVGPQRGQLDFAVRRGGAQPDRGSALALHQGEAEAAQLGGREGSGQVEVGPGTAEKQIAHASAGQEDPVVARGGEESLQQFKGRSHGRLLGDEIHRQSSPNRAAGTGRGLASFPQPIAPGGRFC